MKKICIKHVMKLKNYQNISSNVYNCLTFKNVIIVAQLYTHDTSSIIEKTGLKRNIFYTERSKNLKKQESKKVYNI